MASKIEIRLQKLERQLSGLETEVAKSSQANLGTETKLGFKDAIWSCKKCGFRLGIYDADADELRVRYKDFYAWWKPGKEGSLKLICRGCSEINNVRYTED